MWNVSLTFLTEFICAIWVKDRTSHLNLQKWFRKNSKHIKCIHFIVSNNKCFFVKIKGQNMAEKSFQSNSALQIYACKVILNRTHPNAQNKKLNTQLYQKFLLFWYMSIPFCLTHLHTATKPGLNHKHPNAGLHKATVNVPIKIASLGPFSEAKSTNC